MKFLILLLTVSLSFTAFGKKTKEDKEIIALLDSENYTHVLETPRGNHKAIMVFKENGLAAVLAKKDVLMGVNPVSMKVYKKGSKKGVRPDIAFDGKHYGSVMAVDQRNLLGPPISLKHDKSSKKMSVFSFDGKKADALKTIKLNPKKKYMVVFVGKVKLGTFAGKVNASGKKGKVKYKVFKDYPLGALVARVKGSYIGSPKEIKSNHQTDNVAFMSIAGQKGILEFLINDRETKNNKGQFKVLIRKN